VQQRNKGGSFGKHLRQPLALSGQLLLGVGELGVGKQQFIVGSLQFLVDSA
jgi:hypothetical protein